MLPPMLELWCLVWHVRETGREWRTKAMPRAMAEDWLRTAQETGMPGLTQRLELVGCVTGWAGGAPPEPPPVGWGVRR